MLDYEFLTYEWVLEVMRDSVVWPSIVRAVYPCRSFVIQQSFTKIVVCEEAGWLSSVSQRNGFVEDKNLALLKRRKALPVCCEMSNWHNFRRWQ